MSDALGVPQLSQPDFSDLKQRPGFLRPSAWVPGGIASESSVYFDTTSSLRAGYAYHLGAWVVMTTSTCAAVRGSSRGLAVAEYAAECSIPRPLGPINPQPAVYVERGGFTAVFGVYDEGRMVGFATLLMAILPHGVKTGAPSRACLLRRRLVMAARALTC